MKGSGKGSLLFQPRTIAPERVTSATFFGDRLLYGNRSEPCARPHSAKLACCYSDENLAGKRLLFEQRSAEGKAILRKAMAPLLPEPVTSRTKQGFTAPDASWFRGESIDYVDRVLRSPDAALYEFVDREFVRSVLDEHAAGRRNRRLLIWSLLSFEWWCRTFLHGDTR